MAYEVVMPYHLHMPSYFLETFTEYPTLSLKPTYFFMWFIALRILSAMKLHWHRSAYASHLGD